MTLFPHYRLSFTTGRLKLCMQILHIRALVLSHINPASAASEAVSWFVLFGVFFETWTEVKTYLATSGPGDIRSPTQGRSRPWPQLDLRGHIRPKIEKFKLLDRFAFHYYFYTDNHWWKKYSCRWGHIWIHWESVIAFPNYGRIMTCLLVSFLCFLMFSKVLFVTELFSTGTLKENATCTSNIMVWFAFHCSALDITL